MKRFLGFPVFFVMIFSICSITSAETKYVPIYDYSVNNLVRSVNQFAKEKNVHVWGLKSYSENG